MFLFCFDLRCEFASDFWYNMNIGLYCGWFSCFGDCSFGDLKFLIVWIFRFVCFSVLVLKWFGFPFVVLVWCVLRLWIVCCAFADFVGFVVFCDFVAFGFVSLCSVSWLVVYVCWFCFVWIDLLLRIRFGVFIVWV